MMDEEAICAVCKEKNFGTRLAQMLTGNPNEPDILTLVQRAAREEISNEVLFGTLVEDYGREAVSNALLDAISRSENIPAAPPTSPSPSTPTPTEPSPSPEEKVEKEEKQEEEPEKETKETPTQTPTQTTTETKDICSICVARPLLGILETFKDWFLGKDKEYIGSLADELEKGSLTPEESIKKLYIKFGESAVDGFNRIFTDTNVVFEKAKNLAIQENPELANIAPSPMNELKAEQEKQKNTSSLNKKETKQKVKESENQNN